MRQIASRGRTTARARERLFLISTYRWHQHQDRAYDPTLTQTIGVAAIAPLWRDRAPRWHTTTTAARSVTANVVWAAVAIAREELFTNETLAHVGERVRPLHQHSRPPRSMRTRISASDNRQTPQRKNRCSRFWESPSFELGNVANHAGSYDSHCILILKY
jgi:hypothetical protein